MWSSCQAGTRKAEGSAALPSGVQQRCPRAPTPEPDKGRPTQETGNLKGEKCFCPGVLSSPCPGLPVPGLSWFRVAGSPALLLRVPVCFVPPGVSFYWPAGVAFQLPAGGTSGEAQGHRPKNRPFLVSLFTQYFLPFLCDVRGGVARACFRVHGHMYHFRPPLRWPCLFAWFSSSSSSFSSCDLFLSGAGIPSDSLDSQPRCLFLRLFLHLSFPLCGAEGNAVLISCTGRIHCCLLSGAQ